MSEFTICNYCSLQAIKRDAKKKSLKVITVSSMDGVDIYVLKKGEKPSERNWRCWFMSISQSCCC